MYGYVNHYNFLEHIPWHCPLHWLLSVTDPDPVKRPVMRPLLSVEWPHGTTPYWSVLYVWDHLFSKSLVSWLFLGEKNPWNCGTYVFLFFSCDLAKNWLLVPVEVTSGAKKHFVGSKRSANRILQRWKQIIHFNPIVGGSGLSGIWENPNMIPRAAAW